MTLAEVKTLTPDWSWKVTACGDAPPVEQINVRQPEFFKEMNQNWTASLYLTGKSICAGM